MREVYSKNCELSPTGLHQMEYVGSGTSGGALFQCRFCQYREIDD